MMISMAADLLGETKRCHLLVAATRAYMKPIEQVVSNVFHATPNTYVDINIEPQQFSTGSVAAQLPVKLQSIIQFVASVGCLFTG